MSVSSPALKQSRQEKMRTNRGRCMRAGPSLLREKARHSCSDCPLFGFLLRRKKGAEVQEQTTAKKKERGKISTPKQRHSVCVTKRRSPIRCLLFVFAGLNSSQTGGGAGPSLRLLHIFMETTVGQSVRQPVGTMAGCALPLCCQGELCASTSGFQCCHTHFTNAFALALRTRGKKQQSVSRKPEGPDSPPPSPYS